MRQTRLAYCLRCEYKRAIVSAIEFVTGWHITAHCRYCGFGVILRDDGCPDAVGFVTSEGRAL